MMEEWIADRFYGCALHSVSIESLSYITHRGFSEFDDVFHNTLGTLIEYEL